MTARRNFMIGMVLSPFAVAPAFADPSGRDGELLRLLGRSVQPPAPIANYLPGRLVGNLLYTSTTVARINGVPQYQGAVGKDLTLAEARRAASATALAVLESAQALLGGSLMPVASLINMIGYVASAEGFYQQAEVMDGASDVMIAVLGEEAGRSSRSAVGVKAMSRNAALAISAIFEIKA